MSQPNWKLLANLGEDNTVDYGSIFVFVDETGVYQPEVERVDAPDSDTSGEGWLVHRFEIPQLKVHNGHLIPLDWDNSWPHPAESYVEWFSDSLVDVGACMDRDPEELREAFTSPDPLVRAYAYMDVGNYHGFHTLDEHPVSFDDRAEVEAYYSQEEYKAQK